MAKDDLFKIPIFSWWMKSIGIIPIDRKLGDIKAIKNAFRVLDQGKALVLFPEGTRSKTGELQEFQEGLSWMALKKNVPVLPVYLSGTYNAFPPNRKIPRFRRVRVWIGEVMNPASYLENRSMEEATKNFTAQLKAELIKLRDNTRQ